jgi:hypothetical protein
MLPPKYTSEDVRRYMDEHECGAVEAKHVLERNYLLKSIHIAHENKDFDLLCNVVRQLIHYVRF